MPDEATIELIAAYDSLFVGNCLGWSTMALLIYEYLITFGSEVELFWKQKLTSASALFLINRYLVLGYNLSILRAYAPFSYSWVNSTRAVEILCYLPWAAFSALRVLALSGRNWYLSSVVFVLSIVPIGINFADYHWSTVEIDPIWGCVQDISESAATSKLFTIISRSSLILSDIIVIVVTWITTYRSTKLARQALNGPSLSALLLRDGLIYFIVMLAMNTLHLAFSTSSVLVQQGNLSYIILLVEPMTSILVSRFLLNLQETNARIIRGGSLDASRAFSSGTLYFDRVIGSLGNSVVHALPRALSEDESESEESGFEESRMDDREVESVKFEGTVGTETESEMGRLTPDVEVGVGR